MPPKQAGGRVTAAGANDFTPANLGTTPVAAANFAITTFSVFSASGVTFWSLSATYSGSTLTGGTGSTLTDTSVCTLPAGCRPQANHYGDFSTGAGGSFGMYRVDSTGLIQMLTLAGAGTLAATNVLACSGVFVTG